MSEMPHVIKCSRYYGWLPRHREVHQAFIKEKVTKAMERTECARSGDAKAAYTPPVARFSAVILGDTTIQRLFERIFLQVNTDPQVRPN